MTDAASDDRAGGAGGAGGVREGLEAEVRWASPDPVEVALTARPGEVVALLGTDPDLCGRVLQALAGLGPTHLGAVVLDGQAWDEGGRRRVPAAARSVGMVWPDPLLLPHLDVRTNVALVLDGGEAAQAAQERAEVWVTALGLAEVAGQRARGLTRGQAQRTSLARALVGEPRLLLLDRPLTGLADPARAELRRLLVQGLRRFAGPVVVAVDDPVEAHAVADRLVLVEDGVVTQEGDLRSVTRRPATPWAAEAGMNTFRGQVADGRFTTEDHTLHVTTAIRGPAIAAFAPAAVSLHRARPTGSPRNVWHAGVVAVDGQHGRMRVSLAGRMPVVAEVTAEAAADLELGRGGGIWVAVKATAIEVRPD